MVNYDDFKDESELTDSVRIGEFIELSVEEGKSSKAENLKVKNDYLGKVILDVKEFRYDFSTAKQGRFKEQIFPKNREEAKEAIFKLVKQTPKILTTDILNLVNYDDWEILEILDELKEGGKIK